jgi:hypothetical protein
MLDSFWAWLWKRPKEPEDCPYCDEGYPFFEETPPWALVRWHAVKGVRVRCLHGIGRYEGP